MNGMFARHALHGLRILGSFSPELSSQYPSSKLPWSYQCRSMRLTFPGVFHLCKVFSAVAVSEHPWRIHCSAALLSHHRPGTPHITTCGNDTVAKSLVSISSNVCPNHVPFTRRLHIAWFCIGAPSGARNCVSRGVANRPSPPPMSANDTRFLEMIRLCRECVPHR